MIISKGKVINLKIPGDLFRNIYPQPPLFAFVFAQGDARC